MHLPLESIIRLSIHGIDMMKWINPAKRSNMLLPFMIVYSYI